MFIFQSPALVTIVCFVLPAMVIIGAILAMSSLKVGSDSDDEILGDSQYWSE